MRVILFVGHHKVGSSALQQYLAQHAPRLRQQGVLYPAVETWGMQRLRFPALAGLVKRLPVDIREAHNGLAFGMIKEAGGAPVPRLHAKLPSCARMMANIRAQVAQYQPDTVVIVAEVLSNFGYQKPELITQLFDLFPGAEFTICATFRRLDDYMISWMGQRLRFGRKPKRLRNGAPQGGIHSSYRMLIAPWIAAAPHATVQLTNYADVMASGGAVPAFFAQHNLPVIPGGDANRRMNAGLHRGLIEIARQANIALEGPEKFAFFRALFPLGPKLDLPKNADIEMFGAKRRAEAHAHFIPEHAYLSQIVGKPFFPDFDDMLNLRPVPEVDVITSALAQIKQSHLKALPAGARDWFMQLKPPKQ